MNPPVLTHLKAGVANVTNLKGNSLGESTGENVRKNPIRAPHHNMKTHDLGNGEYATLRTE